MDRKYYVLIFFFVISLVIDTSPARSFTNHEIFRWVLGELNIQKSYPVPQVQLVSRETLQRVYRKNNETALKRWIGRYGHQRANEIMDLYLNELIGLCIPKTCEIYVGNFLEPCRQKAVAAHELTHYIQILEQGPIDPGAKGAGDQFLFNELQAAQIEREFLNVFFSTMDQRSLE